MRHDPDDQAWSGAEARARFSEVIDRALREGPQTITRRGRKTVVVVSADEWERRTGRRSNLAEFLAASPLRASRLDADRAGDGPRELSL